MSWSPDPFDIADVRMAATKALNSPASIPGKPYVAPRVEGAGSNLGFGLKKREALVRTAGSDFSGGFFEVVSTKRDNIHASVCAQCGNPNNLRLHGMQEEVLLFERMSEGQSSSYVSPLAICLTTFLADTLEGASQV